MKERKTKRRTLSARKLRISDFCLKYLKYAAETLPKLSSPKKLNGGTFGFDMNTILDKVQIQRDPFTNKEFIAYQPVDFSSNECGSAGCILGLMLYKASLDNKKMPEHELKRKLGFDSEKLHDLFFPDFILYDSVTNKHAAQTVRTFLKTGEIEWADEVINENYYVGE